MTTTLMKNFEYRFWRNEIIWFFGFIYIINFDFSLAGIQDDQLNPSVKPLHYDLSIKTTLNDENNRSYTGTVNIKVYVTENTDYIKLNAVNLKVPEADVKCSAEDGTTLTVSVAYKSLEGIIEIKGYFIKDARYNITIEFSNKLSTNMLGYYILNTADNKLIATTHFEPNHARRAFPCFDDPGMIATFTLHLGREENYNTLSNMTLNQTEKKDKWHCDLYEKTLPIPTYLLAFTLHQFSSREKTELMRPETLRRKKQASLTFWTERHNVKTKVKLVLSTADNAYQFCETYFGKTFTLTKLDILALPTYYKEATSHLGLVIGREDELLRNEEYIVDELNMEKLIANLVVHQWIGNFIKINTWKDMFLKEGLTSFITILFLETEYNSKFVEDIHIFIGEDLLRAQDFDESEQTQAMVEDLKDDPKNLWKGDSITSAKALFLFRMLHKICEDRVFQDTMKIIARQSVQTYLNVPIVDLFWNSFHDSLKQVCTSCGYKDKEGQLASNQFQEKIKRWTSQKGYPIVMVTVKGTSSQNAAPGSRNLQNKTLISVSQKPARLAVDVINDSGRCWWIPLNYMTKESVSSVPINNKTIYWLDCGETLDIPERNIGNYHGWVIFNVELSGYYRVNYDNGNWKEIVRYLIDPEDYKKIPKLNRMQLINDAMYFAFEDMLDYQTAFNLLTYLAHEQDYAPWMAALNAVEKLIPFLEPGENKMGTTDRLKEFLKNILRPLFENVDSVFPKNLKKFKDQKLKLLSIKWACWAGLDACLNAAQFSFQIKQRGRTGPKGSRVENEFPTGLEEHVPCTMVRYRGNSSWMTQSTLPKTEENMKILACSENENHIKKYVAILETELKDPKLLLSAFKALTSNPVGFRHAKNMLFTNKLQNIYQTTFTTTLDAMEVEKYVNVLSTFMVTEDDLNQLKQFSSGFHGLEQLLYNTYKRIDFNINWKKTMYPKLKEALEGKFNFIKPLSST